MIAAPAFRRIEIVALLLLLLPCFFLLSQGKKPEQATSDKTQPTFKIPVGVVVVNATVTDKDGNPVIDLAPGDFRIYEDGKSQPIQTFALESYKPIQSDDVTPQKAALRGTAEAAASFSRPRMISFMVDDIASVSDDHYFQVAKAMAKFIEQDMGPEDQAEILSGSGRVRFPFSNDKQLLLEEIGTLFKKLNLDAVAREECPMLTDLQAQRIANYRDDGISLQVAVQETIDCMNLDPNDSSTPEAAKNLARAAASRQYQETQYRSRTLLQTLRQHIRSARDPLLFVTARNDQSYIGQVGNRFGSFRVRKKVDRDNDCFADNATPERNCPPRTVRRPDQDAIALPNPVFGQQGVHLQRLDGQEFVRVHQAAHPGPKDDRRL